MKVIKKYSEFFLFCILCVIIFLTTSRPLLDPDMWFHLISGKVIAQQGIIHHDVLSQASPRRDWIPYEWLFQVTFYQFISFFGISSYTVLIGIASTLQIGFL